ncbi:organic cation transporter protein [Aedes albopictus]|uniref:Major facilitator superfamily (MFS) profile domain-containing protein n=1 Tax=Aedes albopictus TaxID=7160 RepID=A0ABM1ZZ07_AEDAL|nr:organic cation transporter protein [Aedes albopictus]
MKRHYFVQMNNQQRMSPVGVSAVSSGAPSLEAIGSKGGGGTVNGGYDGTDDVDQSPPDYGIVNIYQRSNGDLSSLGGKSKNMYEGSHEKSESDKGGSGADEDSDIITEYIGHYGLWQFYWTFLLCLFQIPTTFHIFCLVFQAANRDFWCARPAHLRSIPLELWRNLTHPNGGQCSHVNAPYQQLSVQNFTDYFGSVNVSSLEQVSCNGFEFDSRIFGQTVITEFGLVCDRAQMMSIVEMCFLAGAAMGAVGSGWISDQFGRRHTLMCFALIQAVTGFLLGFVTSLELYMALRVIIGFASMSVAVVSFVLVVELVSGKYRTIIGILNILPVAISYVLAAAIAFFTRDWRLMQFVITTPGACLLLMWYWCPESPRWLLAKGRIDELKAIIDQAARVNGFKLPPGYEKTLQVPETETSGDVVSVFDLFRMKFLRTTLVMLVVWFGIVLIYFGITLHLSNLGGDIYLNTVLAGSVESIAICLSIVVVLKLGLRVNLFLYMVVAGLSCILMNFIPDGNLWVIISLAMIVKCSVGACNAIIPTFTAYQYPTTMRNLGVGAGNFAAGVALIIVPYLWLLEHVDQYLPITIMGVFSIIGGLALLALKDKLSKKYQQRHRSGSGSGASVGSSVTRSTDDDTRRIEKHFPRDNVENGLSNIGFAQNESIFL